MASVEVGWGEKRAEDKGGEEEEVTRLMVGDRFGSPSF